MARRRAMSEDFDGRETGLVCKDPSLAQQSQKEEADINTIVKRFGLTGTIPQGITLPQLDMFVDVMDYQTAQNAIIEADRAFMSLPAEVRARFENNAGAFVDFCANAENLPELRKMGLAKAEEAAAALPPVDVVTS